MHIETTERQDFSYDMGTDNDYIGSNNEDKMAHVAKYLAKPARVSTFNWSTTNVNGDFIYQAPDSWAIVSAVQAWIQKLQGFQGLKATLNLNLTCNATPYSSGLLRLAYYPAGDVNLRKATAHLHPVPFSQLPGVYLNAQKPSCELKIPYIAPTQYYNLTENGISWGSVRVQVLCPYRTGPDNATSVTCTLWAWLTDVELFGQTSVQVVTQSLDEPTSVPPSEKESRPISGFFSNSAKALGSLSQIPSLSSYLGTPIWALNALAGVAAAFGWSKPNKAMLFQRNAIGSLQNMANSDGERAGNSLALLSDAKLTTITGFSKDNHDEASLSFIKQQWSWYQNINVLINTVPGNLISYPVDPLDYSYQLSPTEVYYTPMAYLARWFTLWRGGITYKFQFIKTPFHKGQLSFTFNPATGTSPTIDTSIYTYREIVDLEEVDSIEFTVPYINGFEYLPSNISSGTLTIQVINPLQAPNTVSPTIDIAVFVKGHESLQFARPQVPQNMNVFVTQSLDMPVGLQASTDVSVGFIGNSETNQLNIGSSLRCTSEHVLSLLQIAKRHFRFNNNAVAPSGTFIRFNPYFLPCDATGAQNNISNVLSALLAPFAFFRGGVELNVTDTTVGAFPQIAHYTPSGPNMVDFTVSTPGAPNDAFTVCNNVNGGLLLEAPYYNVARVSPVFYQTNPLAGGIDFLTPRGSITTQFIPASTLLSRAVADDFQMLFFVGIPRMSGTF
nr:MAG: capsid protein [Crogonang virus 83]